MPILLSTTLVLVPSLRDIAPWISLSAGTAPLAAADVIDAGQWARVASNAAVWAGVPFALGWLRLSRREIA